MVTVILWCDVIRTVGQLFELLLQGDGGVEGPEHLGCQTVHQGGQVLVEHCSLQGGTDR